MAFFPKVSDIRLSKQIKSNAIHQPTITSCPLSFRRMSDISPSRRLKSLAFQKQSNICITFPSIVIVCPQTRPFPLSLCITLQQNCPPNSQFLSTLTQCSRYSTIAGENGALNSEFNYSRPSEMLVSRWIKPGSLSKPIFDLKGRHMCFRYITIGLLPMRRYHPAQLLSDLRICMPQTNSWGREVKSNATPVVVNICRNWP